MSIHRGNDERGSTLTAARPARSPYPTAVFSPGTFPTWSTLSLMLSLSTPDLEKMVSLSMKLFGYVGRRR